MKTLGAPLMKANFKQLGLATAVAAATAGYAGITQAALSDNGLGDMAIVPYYTVQGDFVSGLHITNTSNATQVVKLRWRRGSDSMDALDFNLVMSPYDVWTGFIDDSSGNIVVRTDDNTCTAPIRSGGDFPMPGLYAEGAEEGYIEVIGMGQVADSVFVAATVLTPSYYTNPMNGSALHDSDGVPADCAGAESNFFRIDTAPAAPVQGVKGVYSTGVTVQTVPAGADGINRFLDTPNVLKVSYFIRDGASGLEFGSDAVHIQDFGNIPFMTNQEQIVLGADDPYSFLFPDLDGGSPREDPRGRYDRIIRATDGLGADTVINDWSVASARNVSTDWVITLPGQYLMVDLARYTENLADDTVQCVSFAAAEADTDLTGADDACDQRDIPVILSATNSVSARTGVWDREEQTFSSPDGGLVISPEVGAGPGNTLLPNEVNVIEWTAGSNAPVMDSVYAHQFDVSALGSDFGWASLAVSSDTGKTDVGPAVYNFGASIAADAPRLNSVSNPVPMVGFVAWERSFPSDPSANYGRIVDHSYNTSTVMVPSL
jgi:hypothetical protein